MAPSRVTRRARTWRLEKSKPLSSAVRMAFGLSASTSLRVTSAAASTRACAALPVRSATTRSSAPASRSVVAISAPRPFAITKRPRPPRCRAIRSGKAWMSSAPAEAGSPAPSVFRSDKPEDSRCARLRALRARSPLSRRNCRILSSRSRSVPPRPCSVRSTANSAAASASPWSAASSTMAARRGGRPKSRMRRPLAVSCRASSSAPSPINSCRASLSAASGGMSSNSS